MCRSSLVGTGHLRTYCPTSLSLNHFHLPKLEELLDNKPPADLSITIWQDRRTFGIPRSSAKTSEWASTVPPNAFHPPPEIVPRILPTSGPSDPPPWRTVSTFFWARKCLLGRSTPLHSHRPTERLSPACEQILKRLPFREPSAKG